MGSGGGLLCLVVGSLDPDDDALLVLDHRGLALTQVYLGTRFLEMRFLNEFDRLLDSDPVVLPYGMLQYIPPSLSPPPLEILRGGPHRLEAESLIALLFG